MTLPDDTGEDFVQSIYDATKILIRKPVEDGLAKIKVILEKVEAASPSLTERHLRLCNLRIKEASDRQSPK